MNNLLIVINVIIFILGLLILKYIQKWKLSLSYRVFIGLIIGAIFGSVLNLTFNNNPSVISQSLNIFSIVGSGYVKLLQMIIFPLVLISILSAVTKIHDSSSLGKISVISIGSLLVTTAISALIGVLFVSFIGLTANDLLNITPDQVILNKLGERSAILDKLSLSEWVLSFIPSNPFADLTGARKTSIIATAFFAIFLGLAAIQVNKKNSDIGQSIIKGVDIFQQWISQLVRIIINLTPYGVFALITKVIASTSLKSLSDLVVFLLISYGALITILLSHAFILFLVGLNPKIFYTKAWDALIFAFTSRSSAATLPLSIETQTSRLGVPNAIASFAASFGTTVGQNGCAGLYPAMLAAMVAPTVGINPLEPIWLATLIVITTLSSLGVAGVGGGATFAALLVLPMLGLPVELIALLVSIEPLIDMGRTAVNVSGSMLSGTVTSKLLKKIDITVYND